MYELKKQLATGGTTTAADFVFGFQFDNPKFRQSGNPEIGQSFN
jgi:hypothetical protein